MLFDMSFGEIVLVAGAAIIFIGPKDMPRALRTAGQWMGKARRMSNHVRSGFETMIREAELAEMEEQWRAQNAAIMAEHPAIDTAPGAEVMAGVALNPPTRLPDAPPVAAVAEPSAMADAAAPELPLSELPLPDRAAARPRRVRKQG